MKSNDNSKTNNEKNTKNNFIKHLHDLLSSDEEQESINNKYTPNNYNWDTINLYLFSTQKQETNDTAGRLWKTAYPDVDFNESNYNYINNDSNSEIIHESLFDRHIQIEKIDNKHYKISNLFNKSFINDIKQYIKDGDRLLQMFEIITKRKFIFFKKNYIILHTFFIPELYSLLVLLYNKTKRSKYKIAANDLYAKSWISKQISPKYRVKLNMSLIKEIKFTPKPFQLEFIKEYPKQKSKLKLRGSILALDQGLGKTFTSLTLMKLLDKKVVIVVCPKTLLSNWFNEINNIFTNPPDKKYIFVEGNNEDVDFSNLKYIIVNYEKLPKLGSLLSNISVNSKDLGLIVDECQNFKDIDSQRSKNLISFVEKYDPTDCLLLSGTPIKNNYFEFATYLKVLDPKFDGEALDIFKSIFKTNKAVAAEIIKFRFEMISFRKMKTEVEKLPPKIIKTISVSVPGIEKYTLSFVKKEIQSEFEKLMEKEVKKLNKYTEDINKLISIAYNKCEESREYVNRYKEMLSKSKNGYLIEFLDKTEVKELFTCEEKIEDCLKKINSKYYKLFKSIKVKVRSISLSIFGRVIGRILSEKRKQLINAIFAHNTDTICKLINNSTKTVIFTYSKSAVSIIENIIKNKCKADVVSMTGDSKDRSDIIKKFKEDDNTKVFVATYQVASVGLTLIEADTMIYADKPYRIEDLNQAHDRIYRIGQDKPVKIIYLKADSKEPTIQERIDDIVNYYKDITDRIMDYDKKYNNKSVLGNIDV